MVNYHVGPHPHRKICDRSVFTTPARMPRRWEVAERGRRKARGRNCSACRGDPDIPAAPFPRWAEQHWSPGRSKNNAGLALATGETAEVEMGVAGVVLAQCQVPLRDVGDPPIMQPDTARSGCPGTSPRRRTPLGPPHPGGVVGRRPRGSPPGGRSRPDTGRMGRLQRRPGDRLIAEPRAARRPAPARRRATEGDTGAGVVDTSPRRPCPVAGLHGAVVPGRMAASRWREPLTTTGKDALPPASDLGHLRVHQQPSGDGEAAGVEVLDPHARPDGRRGRQPGRRRSAGRRCARTPLVT